MITKKYAQAIVELLILNELESIIRANKDLGHSAIDDENISVETYVQLKNEQVYMGDYTGTVADFSYGRYGERACFINALNKDYFQYWDEMKQFWLLPSITIEITIPMTNTKTPIHKKFVVQQEDLKSLSIGKNKSISIDDVKYHADISKIEFSCRVSLSAVGGWYK